MHRASNISFISHLLLLDIGERAGKFFIVTTSMIYGPFLRYVSIKVYFYWLI